MREISQKRLGSSTGTSDGKVRTEGPAGAGVGSPTRAHQQMAKIMKKHGGKLISTDEGPRMKRVFKEDVEQVDELSAKALKKYRVKSLKDREDTVRQGYDPSTGQLDPKSEKRRKKRLAGFSKAKKKLVAAAEDVEQVDELKKSTLMSYKDKAKKSERSGRDTGFEGETSSEREAGVRQVKKRVRGIDRATKKLVARQYEDVEQVDEVSSDTLRSYVHKRRGQVQSDLYTGKHSPKTNKKAKGVSAALSRLDARKNNLEPKLKREEVEQVDELKVKTLRSYISKAQKDNTKRVTRMADKPDHMPTDKGEMDKLRKRQKGVVKGEDRYRHA